MTITVTQDDIDCGIRWRSTMDPVARAMRRALAVELWGTYTPATFGGQQKHPAIHVTGRRAYVADSEACWAWDLPASVSDWIRCWDNERVVEPFSFDVPSLTLCECGG
ncbi:hypothetical protein LCGC14_0723330 [marine sediment metagenome]|uniref:Uncharacterized protein n=1 Tax=marine sediment metagenome TaxID=412755 RepID=A0A0F9QWT2_9ZZZZ